MFGFSVKRIKTYILFCLSHKLLYGLRSHWPLLWYFYSAFLLLLLLLSFWLLRGLVLIHVH